MKSFIVKGLHRDKALSIAEMTKHQLYYQPKKKRTPRRSTFTLKVDPGGVEVVSNEEIQGLIKHLQTLPEFDYGYDKFSTHLNLEGYIINHKKVYRLMKEKVLLKEKPVKQEKTYVKFRKVLPTRPLEILEMDIKFVWVEEHRRHVYILTVIDTFNRFCLNRKEGYQIKNEDVKQMWEEIIEQYLQPYDCLNQPIRIELRNDNDRRFSAKKLQHFFELNRIGQVFIHPYTPQENGHIESFHSILSRHLDRYVFWSLDELKTNLDLFYEYYNERRLHSSIANLSPSIFWSCWNNGWVERTVNLKKMRNKFKLLIPYYEIKTRLLEQEKFEKNENFLECISN